MPLSKRTDATLPMLDPAAYQAIGISKSTYHLS
jgi:hypothetical protein